MRTNLPVTQNEYFVQEDQLIVSKTDLKGCITYVSPDFVEVSGFLEQELLGQPHNLVRHPDMPSEAFADLWQTLKAGRPWIGLVKNRRKNGDFYWVEAHAAPIFDNGQVVGYLSLRRKPRPEAVRETTAAYAEFKAGKAGNRAIRNGQVVPRGGPGTWLGRMNIRGSLWALYGLFVAMLLGGAGLGLSAMNHDNESLRTMYEERMLASRYLSQINRLILDNNRQVLLALQHAPDSRYLPLHDHPIGLHLEAVNKNIQQVSEATARLNELSARQDEDFRSRFAGLQAARERFVAEGLKPAVSALGENRFDDANLLLLKKMNPLYAEVHQQITELQRFVNDLASTEYQAQVGTYQLLRNIVIAAIVIALGVALLAIGALIRFITRPMEAARGAFQRIAQGDYTTALDIARDDEAGKVLQGLEMLQVRLGNDIVEGQRAAAETERIKTGLYSSTAAITISDERGLLQHATPRAENLLRALCGQGLEDLRGRPLTETVLTDPRVQRDMDDAVTRGHDLDIQLNGHFLRLSARPITNEAGESLGRVTTWRDRTSEVMAEREVEDIIVAATAGEFDNRIELAGKEGFYLSLAQGLNQISDIVSTGLNDVARVLQRVAQGDLTQMIEADYQGVFGSLKDDTNATIERLRELIGQIKSASEAINTAAGEIAAGNQDLSARTEEQASSLEETASSMEELNSTVRNNAENARQANELARSSDEIVTRGGEVVKQVVVTMQDIQSSSNRIADIISVIDSIAFQTNLLALNAAVEAARAGEQGRGFAVVANEVRTLAQRSAGAAKEIKTLIGESVDQVGQGVQLVEQAGRTMDQVIESFRRVAGLVTDISHASREQTHGIEQVAQAIGQIDEVTQHNAALVEESAAAAESLQEQAEGMVRMIGTFRLSGQAAAAGLPPSRPSAPAPATLRAPAAARSPAPSPRPPLPAGDDDEWEEF